MEESRHERREHDTGGDTGNPGGQAVFAGPNGAAPRPERRRARVAVRLVALPSVLVIGLATLHLAGPNLEHVDRRLLRSAQLDGAALAALIDAEGLRTVVNLRGAQPDEAWYREEEAICAARGVELRSIAWSSRHLPPRAEVLALLDLFERGPYPMLVHCRAGADRTGLAATLYRHHVLAQPLDQADDALSLWHGHVPVPWGAAHQVDRFLELYREAGAPGLREFLAEAVEPRAARSPVSTFAHDEILAEAGSRSACPLANGIEDEALELRRGAPIGGDDDLEVEAPELLGSVQRRPRTRRQALLGASTVR